MDYGTKIPLEFTGDGRTYFRIWVVNLFLSVITLGVYSAWAKVRSNRYFYSHLYLDGSSFEYLANPVGILIGRVIAVVLFTVYTLTSRYWPDFAVGYLLLLIPIVPWIIRSSLKFRARNSAYRNIRFSFDGDYKNAFVVAGIYPALIYGPFLGFGIWAQQNMLPGAELSSSVLGLFVIGMTLVPLFLLGFALHAYYDYVVSNSSYGETRFQFRTTIKDYFGLVFALVGIGILVSIVIGIAVALGIFALSGFRSLTGLVAPAVGAVGYIWMIAAYSSRATNLLYNGIAIPGFEFHSRVTTAGMFMVYLINTVLIILTVGFYIPFARIRMIEYRVSCLEFTTAKSLDSFRFKADQDVSATGQEVGEMFDMGLGL